VIHTAVSSLEEAEGHLHLAGGHTGVGARKSLPPRGSGGRDPRNYIHRVVQKSDTSFELLQYNVK